MKNKKPKDENEIAFSIVSRLMGKDSAVSEAARALSKLGAHLGGKARAASLTPKRRKEIAQKAAKERWKNKERS